VNTTQDTTFATHENLGAYFHYLSTSYRLVNSVRVCLATAVCVCVGNILQIPLGFESVIGVLVLFSVYPGLVVSKGTERVLGRLAGIVLALALSGIFYEVRLLYVVSMALVLFWGLYRMLQGKTPYASGHAGMTAVIMMVVATTMPLEVRDFAYHWWFQVALGVVVAMLVARLIPLPTGPALDSGIAGLLANCASELEANASAFETSATNGLSPDRSETAAFSDLMKLVEFERTRDEHEQTHADSYRRLLAHVKVLYIKLQSIPGTGPSTVVPYAGFHVPGLLPRIMRGLARSLTDVVRFYTDRSELVRDSEIEPLLAELTARLDSIRRNPPSSTEEREARKELAALVAVLKDISEEVAQIRGLAGETKRASDQSPVAASPGAAGHASKTKVFNPTSAKKAFRATVCIIALALGLIYMDLPGGAQVLIAALIVGGQANLGKSLLKWRLRLLGVVTGAVYGFSAMVIVSFFPHFPVMLCLLLIGVFIGSYVAMGDDRYSYAGLQMALVCPLVLVYEAGPPIGLGEVESRFWGALLGGVTVTVLGHFLWSDDPIRELRDHLGTMVAKCGERFRVLSGLGPATQESGTPLTDLATTGMHRSAGLLMDARRTLFSARLGLDSYAEIVHILDVLISDLTVLSRLSPQVMSNPGIQDFLSDVSESVARVALEFDRISNRLLSHKRETPQSAVVSTVDEFRLSVERYRATGKSLAHDSETVATLVLMCETIERLCEHLSDIDDTLDVIETFSQSRMEPSHG
jgi:uncharacterized membrane protein YccC